MLNFTKNLLDVHRTISSIFVRLPCTARFSLQLVFSAQFKTFLFF